MQFLNADILPKLFPEVCLMFLKDFQIFILSGYVSFAILAIDAAG